jgi:1-acyl-sn-glycerol-3-phosphate acyltransferase
MNISRAILKIFGWRVEGVVPIELKKFVMIAAPHTSNWDFFIGFLVYKSLGIKAYYLIKKEAFFFPLAGWLKSLGGIPVDRHTKNNVVDQVVKMFNEKEKMVLTVTPEGTRSMVKHWKSGFHKIAFAANVPVVAGFLDYKTKVAGFIGIIDLTGDYDKDLAAIQRYYIGVTAKHPQNFYLDVKA